MAAWRDRRKPLDLPSPLELARLRRELLSQKEMAELLEVDPAQLSRFENGKGGMAYDRIRRYAHVISVRRASSDPHQYLLDRIAQRGPLVELRPTDRLDQALDAMTARRVGQLPVQDGRGEPLGVLTEVAVCEALAAQEPERALARRVTDLPLEPLDMLRSGDSVMRAAALLASHWLIRLVDQDGDTLGYATRQEFFPLLLGHGSH